MSKLKISEELSLPLDAATQTFAFVARKGAGKTYAASKLVELLLEQTVQVVILDTVGNWYGLRIAADGKSKGFDIPVFGGLRGDLPLQASAGELVADIVVETSSSLILDVSQFSLSDRKRFATAFGERLWRNKKAEEYPSPLMLVLEESQLIVPQFIGTAGGDTARMLGIYEEIIRLGRNYGIGVTMISQRPQSVNKEVLNQTECLFVLQVNGAQERKALREWIVHQGMDVKLLDELPSLPVGVAYVWSPQWLGILRKVKIAPKQTFDSSATPKVGTKIVRRNPAPLDLHEIEGKMQAVVERAKQEDPRELRKQVGELRRQLEMRPAEKAEPIKIEVPVLNGEVKEMRELFIQFRDAASKIQSVQETLLSIGNLLQRTDAKIEMVGKFKLPVVEAKRFVPAPMATDLASSVIRLRSGERLMLQSLKQFYPTILAHSKIRLLAGFNFSGKTYDTYKSVLKNKGFVEESNDGLSLTTAGYHYIGEVESAPHPTEELYSFWAKRLRAGEKTILRMAIDGYPQWTNLSGVRDKLPQLSDKSFDTYLSVLRNNNLIETDGHRYRASETFFMG